MFEMSHVNLVLFFITVNILIPGYNLPVLTILLFYILTYELNYKANFHFIVFKFIIYILSCPLLFIFSIQGNNPTVPIYILFSTLFYSILHCILFTILYYMYSILCKSDCFYLYSI